jgi:hypothetical protein
MMEVLLSLKHLSTSSRLFGTIYQNAVIIILGQACLTQCSPVFRHHVALQAIIQLYRRTYHFSLWVRTYRYVGTHIQDYTMSQSVRPSCTQRRENLKSQIIISLESQLLITD